MSKAQEPLAYLVTSGRTYADRPFKNIYHAEASVAERKDGATIIPLYAAPASSEQQAAQQDAGTLTVEEILHIQETHVGGPCPAYPLDNSDWINFARAIESRVIAARASNGGKAND